MTEAMTDPLAAMIEAAAKALFLADRAAGEESPDNTPTFAKVRRMAWQHWRATAGHLDSELARTISERDDAGAAHNREEALRIGVAKKLIAAEAERDALLDLRDKARAWRRTLEGRVVLTYGATTAALIAAVDAVAALREAPSHRRDTLDIAAIQRRVDAATPGPWTDSGGHRVLPPNGGPMVVLARHQHDVDFVAAARTDVPALLSELGYAWHDAGVSEHLHMEVSAERDKARAQVLALRQEVAHLETAIGEEGEHAAAAERDELQQLFDLQQTRMYAATALWRQEDPDARALVVPDLGALLDWLMQRAVVYDQVQGHIYRSTACLHAHEPSRDHLHRECQTGGKRWDGTEKKPAECKYCEAPCQCGCHAAAQVTASDPPGSMARTGANHGGTQPPGVTPPEGRQP